MDSVTCGISSGGGIGVGVSVEFDELEVCVVGKLNEIVSATNWPTHVSMNN